LFDKPGESITKAHTASCWEHNRGLEISGLNPSCPADGTSLSRRDQNTMINDFKFILFHQVRSYSSFWSKLRNKVITQSANLPDIYTLGLMEIDIAAIFQAAL
jgi:hypothetical protein